MPNGEQMAASQDIDTAVPPIAGQLPPQCRQDAATLRRVVHEMLTREVPKEAVSPADFREVLVTGATGFTGRFVLRELLRQDERLVVHCVVRAESAEDGLQRLFDALNRAEIFEESFGSRIRVVPGDICQDRFGLSETEFEDLCQRIDAVYHLAASVDLVGAYASLRQLNVLGLRPVIELCTSARYKHLFYFSTLGIFPEYFCDFEREYNQCHIDDQMPPDLTAMKSAFPLGVIGYPWTKLVAEQGVLFAKAAGVPAAIFRLPQIGLSSTGYTQASDFPIRIFAAATQLEMAPAGFSFQRNADPVDTISEICTAISLNPERRFTIFHCCNPAPPYDDLEVADLGFYWKTVPYRSFKRSCQALGESSPLHGQWVLIDHFAPYWFGEDKTIRELPISVRAIHQDCPFPIKWPALLVRHARSHEWIWRHRKSWPYPLPQGRLDFDGLVAQAEAHAERMEVGFEDTFPAWMRTSLERLVTALRSPEARLREVRFSHVIYSLTRSLRNNAALARERHEHPEIEQEKISRPVFIVGINRTGTTFLHRLLSRDPKFWALRRYELTEPVLPESEYTTVANTFDDPRRRYAEELMHATNIVESFAAFHRVDIDEPEEDFLLLWHAFASWVYAVAHYVPAYGRWLAESGSGNAYAHHRRIMQHFNWQRRLREPEKQRSWLLKMPFHLMELEVLIETYPDAVFVQTHREPVQFIASWNSLVERVRSFTADARPKHETGREQLALMSGMLNDAMRFRASHTELDRRWADVRYTDLVDDPIAVVRDIYARFNWPLDPSALSRMHEWLTLQAEQRRQEPRHEYRLEDYGLTPESVNEAFSPYNEFVTSRGIM